MQIEHPLMELDGRDYDVVVIGGGAAGSSTSQHLAAQGYRTLLVEQGDFGSGTTSRSSRLLYCGLAYFSPDYELWRYIYRPRDLASRTRMAWLAMRNRTHIATTMPERVAPHTFFFPVSKGSGFPAWKVALGYRLLSLFGSRRAPLEYRMLTQDVAASQHGLVGLLNHSNVTHVARFREYQYNWAERICVDTVLDAERCGATVSNYTRVSDLSHRSGSGWQITLEPGVPPGACLTQSNVSSAVTARLIVNTAGPWVDQVLRQALPNAKQHVVGIKGVNLLVRLPDDCRGQGMETISSIGQPFYLMPWGDHHFFGPTETIFEGNPEDARVLPQEIDFILNEANRVFPSLRLTRQDVVYSWCGVRPRTAHSEASGIKSLTIHDMELEGMPNALTLTGTPIMLHRHAGRKISQLVGNRIKPSGSPSPLSYGSWLAPEDGVRKIGGISVASLRYSAQHEHVRTLLDLMFRRVNLGWQPDMGLPILKDVAESVADILEWDDARIEDEIAAYRSYVADHFSPAALNGNTNAA